MSGRRAGSSPRGRGKLRRGDRLGHVARLIPAWAGKTEATKPVEGQTTAHPRVGGENRAGRMFTPSRAGSSPRGRGKRGHSEGVGGAGGLIPAWAGKTAPDSRSATWSAAHPRVGGENVEPQRGSRVCDGSSPRGRGKLGGVRDARDLGRLIPAWAGKTPRTASDHSACRAHPRVGGENAAAWTDEVSAAGSSPRGRGKLDLLRDIPEDVRLIPAWAGKTWRELVGDEGPGAHPRVGGENPTLALTVKCGCGSSPRGRGKRWGIKWIAEPGGLIPAWAGKTGVERAAVGACEAHPRVGGENPRASRQVVVLDGSSPRGRGKHAGDRARTHPRRLIPAWAGKTRTTATAPRQWWAHPRVGGENLDATAAVDAVCGSSPRGRGKRGGTPAARVGDRLIPAWAGKTSNGARTLTPKTAHPRVGGENGSPRPSRPSEAGSSPRGRGKRAGQFHLLPPCGLIPAWAGKTPTVVVATSGMAAHPRVGGENPGQARARPRRAGSSPRGRG